MTIVQDVTKPFVDPYIELYVIDGSAFSAPIYRFTPSSDTSIAFGAYGTFIPFPIKGEGWQATGGQPPRPKLTISNVTKVVQPYLQQYQGMVRATVTRIRTLAKYLDNGATPDATQHLPLEVYVLEQVLQMDKAQIQWSLSTLLDLPYAMLPARQCLKDDLGDDNPIALYAPGLSIVRFR